MNCYCRQLTFLLCTCSAGQGWGGGRVAWSLLEGNPANCHQGEALRCWGAFPVGRARDRGWKCVLPSGQSRAEFRVQSSFLTGDLLAHLLDLPPL